MADSALVSKFGGKKRTPKFEDEGPPSDDSPRGGGTGVGGASSKAPPMPSDDDGDEAMPGDMGPGAGADPEEKAVDDLSDILGVGPEDREDFAGALSAYVNACLAKGMAPDPMAGMGGGPDDMGGAPEGGA